MGQDVLTPEQHAQGILDAQGFIVSGGFKELKIGTVLPGLRGALGNLMHPVVVIGAASREEWKQQCLRFGLGIWSDRLPQTHYYKVIAE